MSDHKTAEIEGRVLRRYVSKLISMSPGEKGEIILSAPEPGVPGIKTDLASVEGLTLFANIELRMTRAQWLDFGSPTTIEFWLDAPEPASLVASQKRTLAAREVAERKVRERAEIKARARQEVSS